MEVYRIALRKHIRDLSGAGARIHGARWHFQGNAVIYASESRALAAIEFLVHVPISVIPSNLKIATIELPDDVTPKDISLSDLPNNWRDYPAPLELAKLGTNWIKSSASLLLRVPSAVVLHEYNILINPTHQDMKRVTVKQVEDFKYDKRIEKYRG